jgi:putative endonuclease
MSLPRAFSHCLRRIFPERSLGERGERAAVRYLRRRGCKIIARGDRSKWGELDIIAVDGRTIVFVEVKARETDEQGHPAEAVDLPKQRRLSRLAMSYLKRHGLLEYQARFDVIAVTWPKDNWSPKIEHFKNAFEPVGVDGLFS